MSRLIVPDYIVYDELKRRREEELRREGRPQLEVPRYVPYWHEEPEEEEEKPERGEVIIPMW